MTVDIDTLTKHGTKATESGNQLIQIVFLLSENPIYLGTVCIADIYNCCVIIMFSHIAEVQR